MNEQNKKAEPTVKDSAAPETEKATMAQEGTPPTKEQVVAFLTEQIEMKTLQCTLQELNTRIAINRAEEMKAMLAAAHLTQQSQAPAGGPPPDAIPHIVTEEDLVNNPDLATQGVKAGDEVLIENPASVEKRSLKK